MVVPPVSLELPSRNRRHHLDQPTSPRPRRLIFFPSYQTKRADRNEKVDSARFLRVAASWAPKRAQRGPHTGRGASTLGLLGDRTRRTRLSTTSRAHPLQCFFRPTPHRLIPIILHDGGQAIFGLDRSEPSQSKGSAGSNIGMIIFKGLD